jgi:hypothetical protein
MMNVFKSREFAMALLGLQTSQRECTKRKTQGVQFDFESDHAKLIINDLKVAEALCRETHMDASASKIFLVLTHFSYLGDRDTVDYSSVAADLRNVTDMIFMDFWKHLFIQVPERYCGYVNNDALIGEVVTEAFPSAKSDIREAGNCIAADSGTAAVFHLMRAVEWGLRALCRHLGILRLPHNKKYKPIAYAEWDQMLTEVNKRVDDKIKKLGPGKTKQVLQEFYYPLLRDIKAFKDAWRNHVMHSRAEYSAKEADIVFDHVKAFMSLLATKVNE